MLDTIRQKLNRCRQTIAFSIDVEVSQPKEKGTCPRSLSIIIQSKRRRESIEVDVLPAYDALGRDCIPAPQLGLQGSSRFGGTHSPQCPQGLS